MTREEELMRRMIAYYTGDPARIQHFIKVYVLSKEIGAGEGLDAGTMEILGAAALVHDIGIKVAEEKYGSCIGKLQEQEGPAVAAPMLKETGYFAEQAERICYLVAHHHTYHNMDGADYQILVEADFLVNLFEDGMDRRSVWNVYHKIFRTKTGKEICRQMFGLDAEEPEGEDTFLSENKRQAAVLDGEKFKPEGNL